MEKKDLLKFNFDYSVCPMYSILHLIDFIVFSVILGLLSVFFLVSLGNILTFVLMLLRKVRRVNCHSSNDLSFSNSENVALGVSVCRGDV